MIFIRSMICMFVYSRFDLFWANCSWLKRCSVYMKVCLKIELVNVLHGKVFFILFSVKLDDATRNKYESLIDCDVEEIGEEFSRKPFALAVQQGSPLRSQMSQV